MPHPLIGREVQKASLGTLVTLFEFDLTDITGEIYRVTPMPFVADQSAPAPESIVFDGNTYVPFPMEASGYDESVRGPLPTPRIKMANVDWAIGQLAFANNDLIGVKVTRIRTFSQMLDGQPDADPDAKFPDDVYRVDRKVAMNQLFVEFELASFIDVEGTLLPRRQVLQGACTRSYRVWDEDTAAFDYSVADCPYVGASYFTATGAATADPAADRCSKRVTNGCIKRFPAQNLPTWAFPGVTRLPG